MDNTTPELVALVTRLTELLACPATVQVNTLPATATVPERVEIMLTVPPTDSRRIIGAGGQHLFALQHLIRVMARSQLKLASYLTVDINGYRVERERTLAYLATESARKATQTGRTVVLKPMSAADRRLIHAALAQRSDVKTHSLGEEPNRRVVVRPVFM
jgi:spoIIIJ-associated protein